MDYKITFVEPSAYSVALDNIIKIEPPQESIVVKSTEQEQVIIGKDKLFNKVTVEKWDLQSKNVEPSMNAQVIVADEGYDGLKQVNVGEITGETKSVELDMAGGDQVVVPSENKVLTQVTVKKPETFVAENIRKNVEIGGVKGTLEGADESLIKSMNLAYAQQMDIMNEIYSGTHFVERDYTDSEMQKLEATLVSLTQGG